MEQTNPGGGNLVENLLGRLDVLASLQSAQVGHLTVGRMLDRFSSFELLGPTVRQRSNFVQGFHSMPVIARA